MQLDRPLVSVIVPMRNAERHVRDTLVSILRERQTSIEVVVVDDCSTDASLERVREISDARVRVLQGPGRGVAACVNAGLDAARGAILMRCDADDLYPEGRIDQQVRWLQEHPHFDAVCGAFSTLGLLSPSRCAAAHRRQRE